MLYKLTLRLLGPLKIVTFSDIKILVVILLARISATLLSTQREETLAKAIGNVSYTISRNKRRNTITGLNRAFGGKLTSNEIRLLARNTFRSERVSQLAFSALFRHNLLKSITFSGLENLDEALARSKGVILWGSSFGNRWLAATALTQMGYKISQVHAQAHGGSLSWFGQNVVRKLYRRAELKIFDEIIEIRDGSLTYVRLMANRLAQNGVICIEGLGLEGHKYLSVDFLGRKRAFPTGTISLAKMTGAAIIPMFCFRDGGEDRIVLDSPLILNGFQGRDEILIRGIKLYADSLESRILAHPEQWNRWHTRSARGESQNR